MGKLTKATSAGSAYTFRDFETGSSGPAHQPDKANIRALFDLIEVATGLIPDATADGTTDDRAAIVAQDGLGEPILLCEGTYYVATNLTITSPVIIKPGSKVKRASGATVTFAGGLVASPASTIFEETGAGGFVVQVGTGWTFAEWWGARADNSTASLTAINAALVGGKRVQLLAGVYRTSGAININADNQILQGMGGTATTIRCTSATAHVFNMAGVNGVSYIQYPVLRDLAQDRTVTPTTGATAADDLTQGHGIHTDMTVTPEVRNVYLYNNLIGVYFANNLAGTFENILSYRDSGVSGDRFTGFYFDGEATGGLGGYPSPNPSLKLKDCRAANASAAGTSYGFRGKGFLSDLYMLNCESNGCDRNLWFQATAGSTGSVNIHVHGFRSDGYKLHGMHFQDFPAEANVTVSDWYFSAAAAATGHGLFIEDSRGVKCRNGQGLNKLGATGLKGVYILDSYQCDVTGAHIDGFAETARAANSTECYIEATAFKITGVALSTNAFYVENSNHCRFDVGVSSSFTGYTNGIYFDAASTSCIAEITRIEASSVTNRANVNGTAVTRLGNQTGGHWITGIGYTNFVNFAAATTGGAPINLPHGTAPTSPTNGDIWTTTSGLSARINGATQTYFPAAGGAITGNTTVGGSPPTAGRLGVVGAAAGVSLALSDNTNSSFYVKHPSAGRTEIGTDSGGQLVICSSGFTPAIFVSNGQKVSVGPSAATPAASSALDVPSTTLGFLPPRMTTTQKNAISSPAAGLIVYDTTLGKLCVRGASAWETITSV